MFKERIYKIWKQFTTAVNFCHCVLLLCSKNEYTKSESNSQPAPGLRCRSCYCVQRTNIQNLKAIHNGVSDEVACAFIVFKERIYKIWKQFTTGRFRGRHEHLLCSKNEYTKSESNSQLTRECRTFLLYCVQRTNIQNLKAIHNHAVCRTFY